MKNVIVILIIVVICAVPQITIGAQLGDVLGPYTVTNIVPMPANVWAEDIVYADNSFYTVGHSYENINGNIYGKIYRIDLTGQLVDTWQIPDFKSKKMYGLAFDGTYFYTVTRDSNECFRKLTLGTAPNVTVDF